MDMCAVTGITLRQTGIIGLKWGGVEGGESINQRVNLCLAFWSGNEILANCQNRRNYQKVRIEKQRRVEHALLAALKSGGAGFSPVAVKSLAVMSISWLRLGKASSTAMFLVDTVF
jgi:hypothetical protein